MRRRAVRNAECELAGMRLGVSDHLGDAARRRLRSRHHDERDAGEHRDRHKNFWIKSGVRVKRGPDRKCGGAADESV